MKKTVSFFLLLCLLFVPLTCAAETETPPLLVDSAGLLTQSEAAQLTEKLETISAEKKFDVVIVTVDRLDGKSPMAFADDYYDYNGYGYGSSKDGCLLLLAMESRDWWVSTAGYGITVITDAGLDYMSEQFLEYFSEDEYYDGFVCFADLCNDFLTQAESGEPYDIGNLPKAPFAFLKNLLICFVIGFLISFIVIAVWKSQLKSVRSQPFAGDYLRNGSLNITTNRDLFLYSTVATRRIERDSGSGGSSTHTSSSGSTHGGGGGKF